MATNEQHALQIAAAANGKAVKDGKVGLGFLCYFEIVAKELLRQGYVITKPGGEQIRGEKPRPEGPKHLAKFAMVQLKGKTVFTATTKKGTAELRRWFVYWDVAYTEVKGKKEPHLEMDADNDCWEEMMGNVRAEGGGVLVLFPYDN